MNERINFLIVGNQYRLYICKKCKIKTNRTRCPKCHEYLTDFEEIILNNCDTKGFSPI